MHFLYFMSLTTLIKCTLNLIDDKFGLSCHTNPALLSCLGSAGSCILKSSIEFSMPSAKHRVWFNRKFWFFTVSKLLWLEDWITMHSSRVYLCQVSLLLKAAYDFSANVAHGESISLDYSSASKIIDGRAWIYLHNLLYTVYFSSHEVWPLQKITGMPYSLLINKKK